MLDKEFDFENTKNKLQEVVNKLETGNCTLNESIKLYEEATKLAKQCQEFLEDAKKKINKIQIEEIK